MTEPWQPDHQTGEATPQEVAEIKTPRVTSDFGLHDSSWSEAEWRQLLQGLVEAGMATWKDVAALVLGHMNPSQVGTSLASSRGFKRNYGKGNTMRVVRAWLYLQDGKCADCGTRLELQADHVKSRESFDDPLDADLIENMTLRCRRCNVVRRPSHAFGGLTFLTAEAALMWILLVIKPRNLRDYIRMCRLYGMTMSDIRMQEAWAMAHWLARSAPPLFGIEDEQNCTYDLLRWTDNAITRMDVGGKPIPEGATRLYAAVPGTHVLGFVAGEQGGRLKFFEHPIAYIPFSTYDLGHRPLQSLALSYARPKGKAESRTFLRCLPPRQMEVVCHAVRAPENRFRLEDRETPANHAETLPPAPTYGRLLRTRLSRERLQLREQTDLAPRQLSFVEP